MKGIAIFYKKIKGYVLFRKRKDAKLSVKIKLKGLPKNKLLAIHVHEFGDMRNGCISLGGHWNPTKKQHGSLLFNLNNHHHGDMINNIESDGKGEVDFMYVDPLLKLDGKNSIFGRSIVIHENKDDLGLGSNKESKITGNAGKRLTCGIIVHFK